MTALEMDASSIWRGRFFLRSMQSQAIVLLLAAAGITTVFVNTVLLRGVAQQFAEEVAKRGSATVQTLEKHKDLRLAISLADTDRARPVLEAIAQGDEDIRYIAALGPNRKVIACAPKSVSPVEMEAMLPFHFPPQSKGDLQRFTQAIQEAKSGEGLELGELTDTAPETLGYIVMGLSAKKAGGQVRRQTLAAVLITAVVLAILFVVYFGWVARRLGRMSRAALRVAGGDLSQPKLQLRWNDEVGRVADAFDEMLESLRGLAGVANLVAQGDLTVRVPVRGEVADAFNGMIERQQSIVRRIAETSASLAGAASEIHASSQEQEAVATQQTSSVEEVSRTMQSLLEAAAHISESARGVLQNAERTTQTHDLSARRITELTTHANRITEILEVIRDIAERSDLLALNASLEGTRAGEAGRGFSLVAGEMRRLAERVTASVEDIKKLVADVRASGSSTVLATEEGRKLAEDTTDSARRISVVTQQQRTGTEQVSQSMKDISSMLTQSTAAVRQQKALAEDLKDQAERLAEVVGQFKLGQK
jgi:methyl-accepting chemotaxis protein